MLEIQDYIKPYYKFFLYYAVFLVFIGIINEVSFVQLFTLIDYVPTFLIFLLIPSVFNYNELLRFNKIIFFFSIIMTIAALLGIITNGGLIRLLTFNQSSAGVIYKEGLVRITGGIFISLYSIFVGFYYLIVNKYEFKKWYLWLVILTSWLFILSSATRGWMIASTFFIVSVFIYYSFKFSSSLKVLFGFAFFSFFGYVLLPSAVKNNLTLAFNRLETIESISEGDLTAEGTASRLTERGPRVLTRFNESPIWGFGYSVVTYKYYDDHVGNHDLLLVGGVLGLSIVWITVLVIIILIFRFQKHGYSRGLMVFGFSLLTIMLIHSTSRNMVSFLMPVDSGFMLALLLGNVNAIVNEGLKNKLYLNTTVN